MDQYKTVVTLPSGWAELFSAPDKVTDALKAYAYVPIIYHAINLRADTLASVGFGLYDESDKKVDWPFETNPSDLIHDLEMGLLIKGVGYVEPAKNKSSFVKDLIWVNPTSMSLEYASGKYTFKQTGNQNGQWVNIPLQKQYQLLYFRLTDLRDDINPGTSATDVALTAGGLLQYSARFASRFFENGAMPVTVMSVPTNITDPERDRTENWFKRQVQGVSNAWKVLAVRGEFKAQTLMPDIDKMTMPELRKEARKDVSYAFGIPLSMLEEDAAYAASAGVHRKSFYQDTVRPRGQWIETRFNQQLFNLVRINGKRLHCKFAFDELDVFQEDESTRSASLLNLVAAGFPVTVAADVLGYDLTDEQLSQIDAEELTTPTSTPVDEQKAKWMRKALKSLEKGKGAGVSFESDLITVDEHIRIANLLTAAKSPAEVRRIFERKDSIGAIDRLNETLQEAMSKLND